MRYFPGSMGFLRLVTPMALGLLAIVSTFVLNKKMNVVQSDYANQQEVAQFIEDSFQSDEDFDLDGLDL
jgi:formyltetrahydrofolate hydrolase